MRRIFVALHSPDDALALLHLAAHLASPFGAHIEAAFIDEVPGPGEEAALGDPAAAAAARSAFEAWSAGLPASSDTTAIKTRWREIPEGVVYASASLGRASDLILTSSARRLADGARVVHGDRGARRFRDALLASGRLTLLAPPGVAPAGLATARAVDASGLLDHVVVAWDGSAGAAQALAQSLPLLSRAKSVDVAIVGRNTLGEGAREAIGSYVALYHADAQLTVYDNVHRQTGRALLDALREKQASLVVMGVSGRSHAAGGAVAGADFTGSAMGGATLKVIEDGRFPILTAV